VLVNNMPATFTVDQVATLFGVYGDVMRVKLLFNKPGTALVQFATSAQADRATVNLNGLDIRGNSMSLIRSKHSEVRRIRICAMRALCSKNSHIRLCALHSLFAPTSLGPTHIVSLVSSDCGIPCPAHFSHDTLTDTP
jgi:hypothetical protein